MRRLIPFTATAGFVALVLAGEGSAVPVTVPTSLAPGAQYRLVFVTSTTRDATSSNIADYNAFVDGVAETVPELAALGQDWKAIGSTAAVYAYLNTSTNPTPPGPNGLPIFLLNDTKLADNYDDLWDGSIDNPLGIDESGGSLGSSNVWTGTGFLGQGATGWQLGSATPQYGDTSLSDSRWVFKSTPPPPQLSPTAPHSFYAISGVLTVPIPEPSTSLLLGAGILALAVARRRN